MADLKGKTVLVTGAAGFIGSHLCDRLLQEPLGKLIGVDNLFLGKEENLISAMTDPRFTFEKADVTRETEMKVLFRQFPVDVVFHLAVIPLPVSLENPGWCFRQNVQMSEVLCELIRSGGKNITLVHYSSSEVYGSALYTPMDEHHPLDSHTPYAASKAAADLLTVSYRHTFGTDMTIVRPFNNYGPRQNEGSYAGVIPITIKRIMGGQPPVITGDGSQTRDFINVLDTTDATVELYKNERSRGEIFNVASGIHTSVQTVIDTICREMKYSGKVLFHPPRAGDVTAHEGSIQKIRELTGFSVKVNFSNGIKDTVKWYQESLSKS